jgi:hypothetical protein
LGSSEFFFLGYELRWLTFRKKKNSEREKLQVRLLVLRKLRTLGVSLLLLTNEMSHQVRRSLSSAGRSELVLHRLLAGILVTS